MSPRWHAPPDTRPAGIVTRTISTAVDLGVILALSSVGYLTVAFVRLVFLPGRFRWPAFNVWFSMTACMVAAAVYLTVCWSTSGRSVGSALVGVRVISSKRTDLSWHGAAIRAVLCVVFPFGLLWAAVDARRRSAQDLLLGTMVVYDWNGDAIPRVSTRSRNAEPNDSVQGD